VRTARRGASLFSLLICVLVAEIGGRVHLDLLDRSRWRALGRVAGSA